MVFSQVTAIGTNRDKHDDVANPPTEESILAEMQLQCSTLWFQTKTDEDERLQKTIKYFIEDLFSWYGGRKDIPFDEVEMFFYSIGWVFEPPCRLYCRCYGGHQKICDRQNQRFERIF